MSRIYQSEIQDGGFQAAQRVVAGPEQAPSSAKQMQQLKEARARDAATIANEINRQNQLATQQLQARQQVAGAQLARQQQEGRAQTSLQQLEQRNQLAFKQQKRSNQRQAKQTRKLNERAEAQRRKTNKLSRRSQLATDKQQLRHLEKRQNLAINQAQQTGLQNLEAATLRAQFGVDQANAQAHQAGIQSLLSFAGSAVQFAGQVYNYNQQQQAKAEQTKAENAELDAAGLGQTFGSPTPVSGPDIAGSQVTAQVAAIESESINTATASMASGDVFEQRTALGARQATLWKKLEGVRDQGVGAISMYRTALSEADSAGLIRPGIEGMQDAQTFTREFARRAGIMGAPRDTQLKFARIAAAANENLVVGITARNNQEIIDSNQAMWSGMASNIADASTPQTAGSAFEQIRGELIHSNSGYDGKVSGAATQAALSEQLRNYQIDGKLEEIQALRGHVYNTATGRTLEQDYDDLFDTAERQARASSIQNFNLRASEAEVKTAQLIEGYNTNPTSEVRASTVSALLELGTTEAIAKANGIMANGLGYDPKKAVELQLQQAKGIQIPRQELVSLKQKGIINDAEFANLAESQPVLVARGKVGQYLNSVSKAIEQGMYGKVPVATVNAATKLSLANRHKLLMADLNDRVMNIVRANPSIADDPKELATIVEQESQRLIQQPHYKLETNFGKNEAEFGGEIPNGAKVMHITKNGSQDFSKFTAEEAISLFPRDVMQADKDTFLSTSQLQAEAQSLIEGRPATKRTREFANALQMDERVFVEAQLAQRGLPTLSYMQSQANIPEPSPAMGPAGDLNINTGYNLIRRLGVPRQGAAYLAGNIQQESSWRGMRDWGQVAGDGTARNGGLVSWASWADSPARLGLIESHFGRPISQITETEQIDYMLKEMKKSYAPAYAAFMNPNSTAADLRAASYQYWGYLHEGDRFMYAEQLLKQ